MELGDFISYCKEKGFVFPSSEIYGGMSGFFDYGHYGVILKRNIVNSYWNFFVYNNDNIISQDGSVITNPRVWEASGHTESFNDPVLITKNHKYRADHFIEDTLNIPADGLSVSQMETLIKENNLKYEGEDIICVEKKNLMLSTTVGVDANKSNVAYLRPETCQSIFLNAKYLASIYRLQLPFGICQVGKAFRNEIAPRNFIFRCREFEQIEMEYFFDPQTTCNKLTEEDMKIEINCLLANEKENRVIKLEEIKDRVNSHHLFWISQFIKWLTTCIGLKKSNLRLREHCQTELSHYSSATFDIDYKFPFSNGGFKELCGIANRTNFDMKQHATYSKKNLYMKDKNNENIYPHVIEPSIGMDRLFMAILCDSYEYSKERDYVVLHLQASLSPINYAIFPLYNKEYSKEIFDNYVKEISNKLRNKGFRVFTDSSGSIGKRYARQDEIGTMYCITVDLTTLKDGTFTVRNRDTKEQVRMSESDL